MSGKTVVITEKDGKYLIQNNGISEFALLGILECVVYNLKTAKREEILSDTKSDTKAANTSAPIENKETVQKAVPESNAPELRTRISNAIKAIKDLGGQVPEFDTSKATDKELQEELEALTEQYKRLKSSKTSKK